MNRFFSLPLFAAIPVLFLLLACNDGSRYQRVEGMVWNTSYHITYQGPESLRDSVLAVLDRVTASLSAFDEKSNVSLINTNRTDMADPLLRIVLAESKKVWKASDGYFDPSIKPLIDAWGFGKGHKVSADTTAIDSILQFTGLDKITVAADGRVTKADPRLQLNLSAIAKGFGCDEVGRMLRRNGVTDYMVEIGGETAVSGKSPRGGKWRIAVEAPAGSATGPQQAALVVQISDCGIATSGNYRNYHSEGNRRFGHTIDPATGRPAHTDVLSATVVAPTCMEADAFATACMAMGSQRARKMLATEKLDAMLILSDSTVYQTPGFKRLITE